MPYNNQPIAPSKEVTGTVTLPLARTKKILSVDDELPNVSNNAAFAITIATEQFIQYLVEQTHNVVKAERKPRRNIQYKDVANAVARHDNLEFLADVVPRTMTFKAYKEKMATLEREKATKEQTERRVSAGPLPAGEPTAQTPAPQASREERPDVMDIDAVAGSPEQRQEMLNGSRP